MRWQAAAALAIALTLSPLPLRGVFDEKYSQYLHAVRLQAAVSDLDKACKDLTAVLASLDYLSYKAALYDNTVRLGQDPGRDRLELLKTVRGAERRLNAARHRLLNAEKKGVKVHGSLRRVSAALRALDEVRRLVEEGRPGASDRLRPVAKLARVVNGLEAKKQELMQRMVATMVRTKYYELVENVLFLPPFNAVFALATAAGP